MKRIVHVTRVTNLIATLVLALGVMLVAAFAAPQQALAATYPTADEVYVGGQPVSEYTYDRYSYDASTGTLTFIENASIQGPIEVRASGARDFTVASSGTLSLYTYSKTEGITTDLYCIANETGGSLTLKATNRGRFMIRAQMTEEKTSIQNIAAVRCTGGVFMQCVDGAYFYIDTTNSRVVDGHAVAATHAPAYGVWAGGQVDIYGTSHAKERSTIYVKNADAELTKSNPSAAIRSDNGYVQLRATGRWYLDTRYNDGAAASIYTASNSRPSIRMENAAEICAAYGVPEQPETDFFVLNGAGESWDPIAIDMYMQSGSNPSKFAADRFWNGVYFRPDNRELVTGTQIVLNEVPPIGAGAQIIGNCTLDALSTTGPRYTLQNITGFRYKVNDDDNWQGIGDAWIPENATRVCAYFKLQANDGYRLCFDTSLVVKLPNGTLKQVTEVNTNTSGGNPAGTPSVGMYYVELDVENDLPDGYDIESVQIEGVEAPLDGKTAKVWTQTSSRAPGDLLPAGKDRTYTWAFTGAAGYSGLVINPPISPGYAYWMDYGIGGADTGTIVEDGASFQKGHEYRFVAFLYSKPGYKFPAQRADCSTYVNGMNAVITTNVNGDPRLAKVEKTFVCPTEAISEVAVVDVTEPVAGATAVADGKVPDGSPYGIPTSSVDNGRSPQYWYEGDANIDQYNLPAEFTGTFEANKWYTYVVYLEPDVAHGYRFNTGSGTGVFQSEVAGTINGVDYADPGKRVGDASNGPIMIRRAFFVPDASAITRIDISQTMPAAGVQSVGDAQSQTDGVTMTAFGEATPFAGATSAWYDPNGSTTEEMIMPVFQAGKTYSFMATAEATSGVFDVGSAGHTDKPAVKAFVEGIPAGVMLFESDGYTTADISLTYTIPAPSDGVPVHCLYVPTGMGLSVSNDGGSNYTVTTPLADNVNIDGSGYDLHFIREDAIVEVGIWWYGSTWRAPEGDEFYKFEVVKGDIEFVHNVTNEWNRFDMPAGDVVIDAVTAPAGAVPKALKWNYFDHRECNWSDDPSSYPAYDSTVKRNWYVLIDGMDASDPSDDYTLQPGIDYSITYKDEAGNMLAYTDESGELVLEGDGPVNAGQVNVTYTGIPHPGTDHPGYEGTYTDYYIIYPADISTCSVAVNAEFTDDTVTPAMPYELFTNTKHEPVVTVTTPWGATLVPDEDYSVYYTDNTYVSDEVYKATAVVSGAGGNWAPYHSKEAFFEIRPQDIAIEDIEWTVADQSFTGNPIDLWSMYQIRGDYNGHSLYPTGEFDITSYVDNVFPGKATITLTGKESQGFTGTKTMQFGIVADLGATYMDYSDIEDTYTFTGSQIKPEPVVKIWAGSDSRTLELGKDYELEYGENTAVGLNAGTVTVVPKDTTRYTGSRELTFSIAPCALDDCIVEDIPNQRWTDSAVEPKPVLAFDGKELVEDTDYRIVGYSSNIDVGVAQVSVEGINNFTGTLDIPFKITDKLLDETTIAAIPEQVYTGEAIEPALAVTRGTETLTVGTDYTVSYSNNVNAGEATVTISGAGDWAGEKGATFTIVPADIAAAKIAAISEQPHTGSAIEPAVSVTLGSKTLTAGTDYTVAYANNVDPGTATVTVTGKGNYSGEVGATFTIAEPPAPAIDLAEGETTLSGATRFGTAAAIALKAYPAGADTAVIANGFSFADALAASSLAGALDAPILTVQVSEVPGETLDALKKLGVKKAYVVGGAAVVSDSVKKQIESLTGSAATRVWGATRYETALSIYDEGMGKWGDTAVVAYGLNFADAVSISPFANRGKAPIFLTDGSTMSADALKAIKGFKRVLVVGGEAVVSPAVESQLKTAVGAGNVTRLWGATRYETSTAIAKWLVDNAGFSYDKLAFATGAAASGGADALAGGVLQGKTGAVLVLTDTSTVPDEVYKLAVSLKGKVKSVVYFGGDAAITKAVHAKINGALGIVTMSASSDSGLQAAEPAEL